MFISAAADEDERWFGTRSFAILLALCFVAWFPQVILGLQTFYTRDFGRYSYPVAAFIRDTLHQGEIPFWNPFSFCGVPCLAQWSTMTLYPLALFYYVLPLSWALGVFCLLHLYLAGFGMYLLARDWVRANWPAAVAGLCFAFNGLSLGSLMWPHVTVALAWMPWVVLLCERAWRRGGIWIWAAAAVSALQFLSGVPVFIAQTWLIVFAVAASSIATRRDPLPRTAGRLFVVGLITVGLTAFQSLPFLDFLQNSHRGVGFGDSTWAIPGTGWANLFVPLFNCYPWPSGVYYQYGQWWISSYYLGIAPLALAVFGALSTRHRRVYVLSFLALLGLVLALGDSGHLYSWLWQAFPFLGFMRFPVKFILLFTFSACLLAAFGARACRDGVRCRTGMLLSVGILFAIIIAAALWFAHLYPLPWERWEDTRPNGLWRLFFLSAALLVAAFLPRVRGRYAFLPAMVLLALCWVDIRTHTPEQNPTISRSVYERNITRPTGLKEMPELGRSRAMMSPSAIKGLTGIVSGDPVQAYLSDRLGYHANGNLLDRIPKVDGFYSLNLRTTEDLVTQLYANPAGVNDRIADLLAASAITAPGTLFTWHARTNSLSILSSGQRPVFLEPDEMLKFIQSTNFAPHHQIVMPLALQNVVSATNGIPAEIKLVEVTTGRLDFKTTSTDDVLVSISRSYYHLWEATVDGEPAPLWRANHGLSAIEVPAGTHRVILQYKDRKFMLGLLVTALTLLGGGIHIFRLRRATQQQS